MCLASSRQACAWPDRKGPPGHKATPEGQAEAATRRAARTRDPEAPRAQGLVETGRTVHGDVWGARDPAATCYESPTSRPATRYGARQADAALSAAGLQPLGDGAGSGGCYHLAARAQGLRDGGKVLLRILWRGVGRRWAATS
jgi:hypothetical protein